MPRGAFPAKPDPGGTTRHSANGHMYHPDMRSKPLLLPDSGPLLGTGYLALWLLLQATAQPYWILPFGLRFAALLLAPMRYWVWFLGAELAATVLDHCVHGNSTARREKDASRPNGGGASANGGQGC